MENKYISIPDARLTVAFANGVPNCGKGLAAAYRKTHDVTLLATVKRQPHFYKQLIGLLIQLKIILKA
jgi:hypothetical protein